jgi:hypothetical protein
VGGVHASSRPATAHDKQTLHTKNRAQAFDATNPHQTFGAQDHLLLQIDPDARHRHWSIRQSVCFRTAGVMGGISTIRTLPDVLGLFRAFRWTLSMFGGPINPFCRLTHRGYALRSDTPCRFVAFHERSPSIPVPT